MDKNSLIIEIKNDINSIKKQVDVTLAKLDVLEALIKLEIRKSCASESRGRACSDYAERSQESPLGSEELGVPQRGLSISRQVSEEQSDVDACVEPEPKPEPEQVIELEIEEKEEIIEEENEEEKLSASQMISGVAQQNSSELDSAFTSTEIPHSSLLTPNSDSSTPNCETELRNLMSVIGLNDRFRFRHDLFSNSDELFRETIDILNKIENFDSAVDYLMKKFAWDEEDATVVYFYDIIKPKF